MEKLIYADNAATTELDIDAFQAMKPFLLREYGNASQPYSFSLRSKEAIKGARETIAKCINADPDEIYFTSGGTESDNWALNGVTFLNRSRGTIVTDDIEHHAILKTCESLEKMGYSVVYLTADDKGVVSVDKLAQSFTDGVTLVSIMLANNEVGSIQPIKALSEYARGRGALFHTDAVQAVGHIPVDVKDLGVDMLSASAHKFNGPKGIGFLYIKRGTKISPYFSGGHQEMGLRAGTENTAAIVGMSVALKKNIDGLSGNISRIRRLEEKFYRSLTSAGVNYIRNGAKDGVPGIINISFKGMDGEAVLHGLDLMGVAVSTGAACDNTNTRISHVLKAMNVAEEYAKGTIRISLSKNNNMRDVEYIAKALAKIIR